MGLSGSELARLAWEGEGAERTLSLHFAVVQVRPVASTGVARFGQGDDTAYLPGVVWHVSGAEWAVTGGEPADALGRLSDSRLVAQGQVLRDVAVPDDLAGPLSLALVLANGCELRVQGRSLRCEVEGPVQPLPALAC